MVGSASGSSRGTHRVAFEEVSGHRVLIKSGSENRSRSARGTSHVASLEFPRETGLILRCARKAGNPFQTMQGNRLSCRDQEGRRGSDEVVPGTSVFPSREPSVSGNFCGRIKGVKYRFALQGGTPAFLPGECQGQGSLVGCRLWGRTSRIRLK